MIGGFVSPVSDAYEKKGLVSSGHRLEMCRLALEDHNWVSLDCWETSIDRWSTTVDVLRSLQRRIFNATGALLLDE